MQDLLTPRVELDWFMGEDLRILPKLKIFNILADSDNNRLNKAKYLILNKFNGDKNGYAELDGDGISLNFKNSDYLCPSLEYSPLSGDLICYFDRFQIIDAIQPSYFSITSNYFLADSNVKNRIGAPPVEFIGRIFKVLKESDSRISIWFRVDDKSYCLEKKYVQEENGPEKPRRKEKMNSMCIKLAAQLGDKISLSKFPEVNQCDWENWKERKNLLREAEKELGKPKIVEFTADIAERTLHIFEAKYPGDLRPREAIAAARAWAKCPCEKHKKETKKAKAAADAAHAAAAHAAAAHAAPYAAAAAHAAHAAYAAHAAHTDAADAAAYVVVARKAEFEWQKEQLISILLNKWQCCQYHKTGGSHESYCGQDNYTGEIKINANEPIKYISEKEENMDQPTIEIETTNLEVEDNDVVLVKVKKPDHIAPSQSSEFLEKCGQLVKKKLKECGIDNNTIVCFGDEVNFSTISKKNWDSAVQHKSDLDNSMIMDLPETVSKMADVAHLSQESSETLKALAIEEKERQVETIKQSCTVQIAEFEASTQIACCEANIKSQIESAKVEVAQAQHFAKRDVSISSFQMAALQTAIRWFATAATIGWITYLFV